MQVPKIHPDEFGPGYMIRLGLVNGMASEKEVINDIIRTFSIEKDRQNLIAYQLSKVTGMSLENYCQQHTLLPLHNCVSNRSELLPHGTTLNAYIVLRYGHRGLIKTFKICKSCLEEDIAYWGYGYYRRSHQFPGIRYCTKHGNTLKGTLYSIDSKSFSNPEQISKEKFKEVKQHTEPPIIRYHQLIDEICQLTMPVKSTQLVTTLQLQASLKGLSWGTVKTQQKELFSDRVLKVLPKEWAEELFVNYDAKIYGKRFGGMDGLLSPQRQPFKSSLYILTLAILFDDPDVALRSLVESGKAIDREIKTVKRYGQEFWRSKDFLDAYIRNDGQASQIGRELGLHPETVSNGLKFINLPALGPRGSKVIEAYKGFLGGLGLIHCLAESKINPSDIEALIRIQLNRF